MSCGKFRDKLVSIMNSVQQSTACHQKHINTLLQYYDTIDLDVYVAEFLEIIKVLFVQSLDNNQFLKRSLKFCSQCCAHITRKTCDDEENPHPFLTKIITETLKFTNLQNVFTRYHSCEFVMSVLENIDDKVQLDNDLCDEIQKAMLDRLDDPKIQIRLQAISTLIRLQDPMNQKCPVIKAYLSCLVDPSPVIRRACVKVIAPNNQSLPNILRRINDIDPSVRCATFNKFADIGPGAFKIIERINLFQCGFNEKEKQVQQVFYKNFIPKWFLSYKESYLDILKSLKLSCDEKDLETWSNIGQLLLNTLFKSHSLNEIVSVLNFNEQHVIPLEELNNEKALYWNILIKYLRSLKDVDDYIEESLPDLVLYCEYIDKYIKLSNDSAIDDWKLMEYQFNLLNLFDIMNDYDLSDEISRQTAEKLCMDILLKYQKLLTEKSIDRICKITFKCSLNVDDFTTNICQLICEIKEPLIEQEVIPKNDVERNLQITRLKVKKYELQFDLDKAVAEKNFSKAKQIHQQRLEVENELNNMVAEEKVVEHVRVVKNDEQTNAYCLDILIAILKMKEINKLTPSLECCKNNFLKNLIINTNPEIHWRVLNVLGLISIIDENCAKEWAEFICLPTATYRHVSNTNPKALLTSIKGISDLLCLYGIEIVGLVEEEKSMEHHNNNMTKRTLYSQEECTIQSQNDDSMTFSSFLQLLLEFIDEDHEELKITAVKSLSSLITRFAVSPNVISRIILKWYSPVIGKEDRIVHSLIGNLIHKYISSIKSAKTTIKNAIIPTLEAIAKAPRTSPLVDIDTDNLTKFFAAIISLNHKDDVRVVALELLMEISENIDNKIVPNLIKIISRLDLIYDNNSATEELLHQSKTIHERIQDNNCKKILERFINKIDAKIKKTRNRELVTNQNDVIEENEENEVDENPQENRRLNISDSEEAEDEEEQQQPPRILNLDNSRNPIPLAESTCINLERRSSLQRRRTTTSSDEEVKKKKGLNTIKESSTEQDTSKSRSSSSTSVNITITSESEKSDKSTQVKRNKQPKNKYLKNSERTLRSGSTISTSSSRRSKRTVRVVISETSDTDATSSTSGSRRSRRKKKKN